MANRFIEPVGIVHLVQGPNLNARLIHVDDEERQPLVFRGVGVRARQQHCSVGILRTGRPHLLAVDDPFVAVAYRTCLQTGQIGTGAGL
jgi:hypothetical protein